MMPDNTHTKKQLEELAKQIKHDQAKVSPAEKRVKINATFRSAIKKMGRSKPPTQK